MTANSSVATSPQPAPPLPFYGPVLDDFSAVNALIPHRLTSDVHLVEEIGQHLVEAGGKRLRPLTDFAEEYVAARGGWERPEDELEELHRDATRHARSKQRWISWGNVLGPVLLVLVLAMAHFSFHRRRAARPFRAGGGGTG